MASYFKPVLRRSNQLQRKKAVRCIDTGIVYPCVRDAADVLSEHGINTRPEAIKRVCKGERKTAGGFRWEFGNVSSN